MGNFGLNSFWLVLNFVIFLKTIDSHEKIENIPNEVLNRSFIQLFIHFSLNDNQSQSEFFFGAEEVIFKSVILSRRIAINIWVAKTVCTIVVHYP